MKWKFYQDKRGKWRWRVRMVLARRSRIVGASTQGYVRRIDCRDNARLFGYKK